MQTIPNDIRYLPEDRFVEEYEKSVLIIAQRRMLKELFLRNTPISLIELLSKLNISINAAAGIYQELNQENIINFSSDGFSLTPKGRLWTIQNRKKIFMNKTAITHSHPELDVKSMKRKISPFLPLPKKYRLSSVDIKNATMLQLNASSASEGESPFG